MTDTVVGVENKAEKFEFNVDEFLSKYPASTREFFRDMEAGFRRQLSDLQGKMDKRVSRAQENAREKDTALMRLNALVDQQREEVNRLNAELVRVQGEKSESSQVGPLRQQIATLERELSRRRDATKTVEVRDQTIRDLRQDNAQLRTRLDQALQHDVQAECERLRGVNRSLMADKDALFRKIAEDTRGWQAEVLRVTSEKDKELKERGERVAQLERELAESKRAFKRLEEQAGAK